VDWGGLKWIGVAAGGLGGLGLLLRVDSGGCGGIGVEWGGLDDRDPGMGALHKAPGRRGILGWGLRGCPGWPPFWRTLISPARGWTPVPSK